MPGDRPSMPFAIPRMWKEPQTHVNDLSLFGGYFKIKKTKTNETSDRNTAKDFTKIYINYGKKISKEMGQQHDMIGD